MHTGHKIVSWIRLRFKILKAYFTRVYDYETLCATEGKEYADHVIDQIHDNMRAMRARGITKLHCPKCGTKDLPDPDTLQHPGRM